MPRPVTILTEADLRARVSLDLAVVETVADAFVALATKPVAMPPILRLDIPEHNGEVDVKTAYVPGLPRFAIKISPGFFDNPNKGLPSVNGMMTLFSSETGLLEAVLLDNGYLTDVRTAAAGAVAARALSRPDAHRAAIFGAGVQARLQLTALALVRPLTRAVICARNKEKAAQLAARLSAELDIPITAETDGEEAVASADIIVTTTPATSPILHAAWLRPGQHITAMGSDAEHKNEIEPAIFTHADLVVCDRLAQCMVLGEVHHAIRARRLPATPTLPELGQVLAGQHPGRVEEDQITLADLTGTGVQDTAIASFAYDRCRAAGAGSIFSS